MRVLQFLWILLGVLIAIECAIEIDIIRHKSARHMLIANGADNTLDGLYKPKPKPNKRVNDTAKIYKYMDTEFFTYAEIGNPGQRFRMAIDIEWDDSWILSKSCPTWVNACKIHRELLYDHYVSSTYVEMAVNYTSTDLSGYYSMDKINIGHSTIQNQTFIEITNVTDNAMFIKATGSLGFGMSPKTSINTESIFYNMIKQDLIKQYMFSIFLNSDETTIKGGSLVLGDVNEKFYNPDTLFYVPVTNPDYWEVKMQLVNVTLGPNKSYYFCTNGCKVTLSTTSNMIEGPPADIHRYHKLLAATERPDGRFQIDCTQLLKLPKTIFTIEGKNFLYSGKDLGQKINNTCLTVFSVNTYNENWILGTSFLQKVYSVYKISERMVGFALPKNHTWPKLSELH